MKNFLLVLSVLGAQASFASISASSLEARHQAVIEKAIEANCGFFRDLTEVASSSTVIQVDNGIRDVKYSTLLTGLQRMDQNIFDRYAIAVESEYSDMYDHSTQNWGVYSVSNVSCVME